MLLHLCLISFFTLVKITISSVSLKSTLVGFELMTTLSWLLQLYLIFDIALVVLSFIMEFGSIRVISIFMLDVSWFMRIGMVVNPIS